MNGLMLSKKYFFECGKDIFKKNFPDIYKYLAFSLIGCGSECLGFDDKLSEDHDFEPGFLILVPKKYISEPDEFKIMRTYENLPKEFLGYKKCKIMHDRHRHGFKYIEDFLIEKLGIDNINLTINDWFSIPEQMLLELTSGEIFEDNLGLITKIRFNLSVFPSDIRLKKISGVLLSMMQTGGYNYERCMIRNDYFTAKLTLNEYINYILHLIFLINEVYMPFYKWRFRLLKTLSWPIHKKIISDIEELLYIDVKKISYIKNLMRNIEQEILKRLEFENIIKIDENKYLDCYALEVNNKIKNVNIRNMNILVGA